MSAQLNRLLIALLAICAVAVGAAPVASASASEGLEMVPAPTEAAPEGFTAAFKEGVSFKPQYEGGTGAAQVFCESGAASGSFTSARKGTAHFSFSHCRLPAIPGTTCKSPGAASGTIETVSLRITLTRAVREGQIISGFVINPAEVLKGELGAPHKFIEAIECGSLHAGQVQGVGFITLGPVGTKTKSFSAGFTHGSFPYWTTEGKNPSTSMRWENFSHTTEEISIFGSGSLTTAREVELRPF
jgi:hypothetical protein